MRGEIRGVKEPRASGLGIRQNGFKSRFFNDLNNIQIRSLDENPGKRVRRGSPPGFPGYTERRFGFSNESPSGSTDGLGWKFLEKEGRLTKK